MCVCVHREGRCGTDARGQGVGGASEPVLSRAPPHADKVLQLDDGAAKPDVNPPRPSYERSPGFPHCRIARCFSFPRGEANEANVAGAVRINEWTFEVHDAFVQKITEFMVPDGAGAPPWAMPA